MSEGKRRGIIDGDRFVPFIMGGLVNEEVNNRKEDYHVLSSKKFATKYSKPLMFREVGVFFDGTFLEVQMNFCTDPFCTNFGKPQSNKRISRKYRYKSQSTVRKDDYLVCNEIEELEKFLPITSRTSTIMSNQSIANEISRLYFSHKTMEHEPEYRFHQEDCPTKILHREKT